LDDQSLRRRLIKGTVAAPLVLTVSRASAGSVSRTTFSGCLVNTDGKPQPRHVVAEPDEVFRISRDVYEVHRGDNKGRRFGPNKGEGRYVLGWDDQTLYRIDGDRLVSQYEKSGGAMMRTHDMHLQPTGKKVELLAYVDEHGNVLGLAPEPNGGSWCYKSCYASVVGMPKDDKPRWFRRWG